MKTCEDEEKRSKIIDDMFDEAEEKGGLTTHILARALLQLEDVPLGYRGDGPDSWTKPLKLSDDTNFQVAISIT